MSRAQDAADTTPQFKHSRVYVGPSHRATTVLSRAGGLQFVATFDVSIIKDKNAAAIMATLNAAMTELASNYSDPITVTVTFKNVKTGLGASSTAYTSSSYADYLTALKAHATTANDTLALSRLPVQTNNPVTNDPTMNMTLANARALGFAADNDPGETDSTISLNISLMNITASDTNASKYSLRETALHELTEVLGTSSALDEGTTGAVNPMDLFRYDAAGNRSYTQSSTATSFFSLDGTTMLAQFNQDKSGDFGDYFSINGTQVPQIQDAFGTPGVSNLKLNAELTSLDVVGFTRGAGGGTGTGSGSPPVIASAVTCTPNPAYVGGVCIFSVSATDPNNSPITISWDFGDGTKGANLGASHVYATTGNYVVTATAVDGLGLSTSSSVVVNVSLTMQTALIVKQSFALNFKFPNNQGGLSSGKDKLDITLQNDDFAAGADGTEIDIILGGNTLDSGTLFKNKAVGESGGKFTVNVRQGTVRYTTKNAALQAALGVYGAMNEDAESELQIPISVSFNGVIYGDTYSFTYSSKAGKTGKGF